MRVYSPKNIPAMKGKSLKLKFSCNWLPFWTGLTAWTSAWRMLPLDMLERIYVLVMRVYSPKNILAMLSWSKRRMKMILRKSAKEKVAYRHAKSVRSTSHWKVWKRITTFVVKAMHEKQSQIFVTNITITCVCESIILLPVVQGKGVDKKMRNGGLLTKLTKWSVKRFLTMSRPGSGSIYLFSSQ